MTSDFQDAVGITLKNEGGLSNDKDDPGGITKYGISLRFLQENDIHVDNGSSITAKDIQDLTVPEAISIYKAQFWDKLNIGFISNPGLADKVFDLSVNMGGEQAIKLLQEAINCQLKMQIQSDGIIGKMTLIALNNVNTLVLINQYKKLACEFYKNLASKNTNLLKFLPGWLARANQ